MERARAASETSLLCLLRRVGPRSSSSSESFARIAELVKDDAVLWRSKGRCCDLELERREFCMEVSDTSEALSAEAWTGGTRVSGYSSSKRWIRLVRVLSRKRRRPKYELVIHRIMDTDVKWNVR